MNKTNSKLPLVLVVDDDPNAVALINDALADDFQVHACQNSGKAVELARELKPLVIVLDIRLPGSCGLEVCRQIRATASHYPMVMLISGDNSPQKRLNAFQAGGDDYLNKPFDMSKLRARVAELAAHHPRMQAQLRAASATPPTAHRSGQTDFLCAVTQAADIDDLRRAFFQMVAACSGTASIQFRLNGTRTFEREGEHCRPLELEIYRDQHRRGKKIASGGGLMANGSLVSFIVVPRAGEEALGDEVQLAMIVAVDALDGKLLDWQRRTVIRQASGQLTDALKQLSQAVDAQRQASTEARQRLAADIEALALSDAQRRQIHDFGERLIQACTAQYATIDQQRQVLDEVSLALAKQR